MKSKGSSQQKGKESEGDVGTEAWNVADGYAKLKILKQLINLDRWDTIAQFGTEEVDEELNYDDNYLQKRRVEALYRFHSSLKQLIGNSYFALSDRDQERVKFGYLPRLDTIKEFLPKTYENFEDEVSHEEKFNVKSHLFNKILSRMETIKDELNIILNRANLIFKASEEVDLDKIQTEIVEGG